ncbi:MAG: dihydroneopterin aldolase [Sphingobacteriaceae bacterium]|nr:MAG: dihydroneopterin aldolase [Sphingobacteriaceae bacterium]
MMTVSLKGAEFFAYHGYYPEEQLIGTAFIVDIDVTFEPSADVGNDDISGTVNYEQLYNICCHEMKTPRKLIETVASDIIEKVKAKYDFAEEIILVVKKRYPPFKGIVDHSAITIRYNKS